MQHRIGRLSFIEMVEQICDEIGMMPPQDLNDQDDDLARQFKALANKTGRLLADEFNWPVLIKERKGDEVENQDFLRYIDHHQKLYISAQWVVGPDAVLKSSLNNKNDHIVFTDDVFMSGLKARFLEAKGFDATQAYREHEKCVMNALAKDNFQRQKKNLDLGFEGSKPSGGLLQPLGL